MYRSALTKLTQGKNQHTNINFLGADFDYIKLAAVGGDDKND